METLKQHVDALLRQNLAKELKLEGFKKSGRAWRKVLPDYIQITSAQIDEDHNESDAFTLNLAVYFPAVEELGRATIANAKPDETDCLIRTRIGQLMPAPADHWWRIGADVDDTRLASEVADAWIAFGKPWLESHSDAKTAQEFLVQKQEFYWAAVFALQRDSRSEASALLQRALEDDSAIDPKLAIHMRAWGTTHELLTTPGR